MMTRAAVLREFGAPATVEELEVPELETGALLMEVEAATVCGTDVHIQRGRFPSAQVPLVMGHESVGRVVATNGRYVDSNDQSISVGDRIVFAYPWCGSCYWCTIARQPTLCQSMRMYGWGPSDVHPYLTGTFAEHVYVSPGCKILKVSDDLDAGVVASSTCALRSVMHAFERLGMQGPVLPSDTVAVIGSGAIGLYATAVALASGAGQVILVGAPAERLRIGESWGASEVLDITTTSSEARLERVLALTDGRGADIAIDCAGPVAAFGEALEMTRRGGRVLEIGIGTLEPLEIRPHYFNIKMISVTGSISGDIPHFWRAVRFLERHRQTFDFEALTAGSFSLDNVNEALSAVEEQRLVKPRLTFDLRP